MVSVRTGAVAGDNGLQNGLLTRCWSTPLLPVATHVLLCCSLSMHYLRKSARHPLQQGLCQKCACALVGRAGRLFDLCGRAFHGDTG